MTGGLLDCCEFAGDAAFATRQQHGLVATGEIDQPPHQSGKPRDMRLAHTTACAVFGRASKANRSALKYRKIALGAVDWSNRIGGRHVSGRGLGMEEWTIEAMLGSSPTRQAPEVEGFRFAEIGRRHQRWSDLGAQAVTSDPHVAEPGLFHQDDAGFLVVVVSLPDVPSHERVANERIDRDSLVAPASAINQPHGTIQGDIGGMPLMLSACAFSCPLAFGGEHSTWRFA